MSAEDTVARKLRWYALGDEVADRQWSDAVGVLKVTRERLDPAYVRRIATAFEVEDPLRRALEASGLESQGRG